MDAVDSRKRRREPSSVFSISCVPATDNLVFGCLRQADVAAHTTTTAPLGLHALTPQQRAVLVRDPSSSRARVSRYYAGEAAASPNVGQFRKRTSQNRNTGQAPGAQQQFVPRPAPQRYRAALCRDLACFWTCHPRYWSH